MKPIFISLSPNVEPEDRALAKRLVVRPWEWTRGPAVAAGEGKPGTTEEWFKSFFDAPYAWSVNSGRSALLLILRALDCGEGDEVLLQTFTCNAVPNPVQWLGATPVYVDIDPESLNIDPEDLERKLTPRSKAIIVQHTFGQPCDIEAIRTIAQKHQLTLIEDCAHALGAMYQGKKVGTLGDIAFFSFGRDKVISSVFGGMIITHNHDLARKVEEWYSGLPYPPFYWTVQQLLHPILMEWIINAYESFGKFFLVLLQYARILSRAVSPEEKRGEPPMFFPYRLPNALGVLARSQLSRLERFNDHRKKIAQLYQKEVKGPFTHLQQKNAENGIFLRYTLRYPKAREIIKTARKQGLYLGDWYTTVIDPKDTLLSAMHYVPGSCPHAERLSKEVLNLPTHIRITEGDAKRIVEFLTKV